MTKKEIMDLVDQACKENHFHYIIMIDDGKSRTSQYVVDTDSKLHDIARAMNEFQDHVEETTTI